MREIVLDTETTGLSPDQGHRVVEVGCIELLNRIPTGATFHAYLNPDRDMPAEAFAVHGLSVEFLKDKPRFADVADDFLAFLGDSPLVAHNAGFDYGFICHELKRAARPELPRDRVVDTLMLARRKHAAGPYSLDALCARYGIDNSRRTKHGALLDAEILAEVYLELIGGRQAQLGLADNRAQVPHRGAGLQRHAHRTEPDAGQVDGGVVDAGKAQGADEVTRAQRRGVVVVPVGGHRADPRPQLAVGHSVKPRQQPYRGGTGGRVADQLADPFTEGGPVRVPIHDRGDHARQWHAGLSDRIEDHREWLGVLHLRITGAGQCGLGDVGGTVRSVVVRCWDSRTCCHRQPSVKHDDERHETSRRVPIEVC